MTPERFAELREQKDQFDAICEQAEQAGWDAAATTMTWADIVSHALADDEAVALQTPGQAADILKNHAQAAYIRGVRRVYEEVMQAPPHPTV
jgi:hypothetical protein